MGVIDSHYIQKIRRQQQQQQQQNDVQKDLNDQSSYHRHADRRAREDNRVARNWRQQNEGRTNNTARSKYRLYVTQYRTTRRARVYARAAAADARMTIQRMRRPPEPTMLPITDHDRRHFSLRRLPTERAAAFASKAAGRIR